MTLYYSLIDFTKLYSEIISISGTIITIISMIVTIIYTMKTKNYKKQAEYDIGHKPTNGFFSLCSL